AGAGRAPEDERADRARRDHARERAIRPQQMILADDLGEALRAQLVGERARGALLGACRLQQIGRAATGCAPPLHATGRWLPPRTMVMRHTRALALVTRSRSRVLPIFSLFTDSTTSPVRKPTPAAVEPSCTSTITTPSALAGSRNSSATAGDRLATLAPTK